MAEVRFIEGKIDYSALNTRPYPHELSVAELFAKLGKTVVFLKPSNMPGVYTPDVRIEGLEWEIKSPNGKSERTIRRNLHIASRQSRNIIFDLSRIEIPEDKCIKELRDAFNSSTHIKNLIIITKAKDMIRLRK